MTASLIDAIHLLARILLSLVLLGGSLFAAFIVVYALAFFIVGTLRVGLVLIQMLKGRA